MRRGRQTDCMHLDIRVLLAPHLEWSRYYHPFGNHAFDDVLRATSFDDDSRPIRLKTVLGTDPLFYEFLRRGRQRGEKNNRAFVMQREISFSVWSLHISLLGVSFLPPLSTEDVA